MRAHAYERFDGSAAWSAAHGFLKLHGRTPDGEALSGGLLDLLMVGVWTGCRMALLERELAVGIAEAGNGRDGVVFDALMGGFEAEFGESVRLAIELTRRAHGFPPTADTEVEADWSPEDAVRAAVEWLQQQQGGSAAGSEEAQ